MDLHNLLPVTFCCMSSGVNYRIKITMKQMNESFCLKCKTNNHIRILNCSCFPTEVLDRLVSFSARINMAKVG